MSGARTGTPRAAPGLRRGVLRAAAGLAAALALTACTGLRPSLEPYAAAPAELAGPVTARFMGASTLSFTDGATTLLIDGFFSRPGAATVLFAPLVPDEDRIDDALTRAGMAAPDGRPPDAIFVAHAHYDHVLDAATVARRGRGVIYGSASVQRIARAEGLTDGNRTVVLTSGQTYRIGRFAVTAYRTPHSRTPLFWLRGDVDRDFAPPAPLGDYQEGDNFAFLIARDDCRILVTPSGAAGPGDLDGAHAGLVFLGIGQLGLRPQRDLDDYWRAATGPGVAATVIPVHWDDFTRSLDAPLAAMPWGLDRVDRAMRRLRRAAARDHVRLLRPTAFTPMDVCGLARRHG